MLQAGTFLDIIINIIFLYDLCPQQYKKSYLITLNVRIF